MDALIHFSATTSSSNMTKVVDDGMNSTHISDIHILMGELAKAYRHMLSCGTEESLPKTLHLVSRLVPHLDKESWNALRARAPAMGWCALECSFENGHLRIHVPDVNAAVPADIVDRNAKQRANKACVGHQDEGQHAAQGADSSHEPHHSTHPHEDKHESDSTDILDEFLKALIEVPFLKQLEQEIARAARGNSHIAVVHLAFQAFVETENKTDPHPHEDVHGPECSGNKDCKVCTSSTRSKETHFPFAAVEPSEPDVGDDIFFEAEILRAELAADTRQERGQEPKQDLTPQAHIDPQDSAITNRLLPVVRMALRLHASSCDTIGIYQGRLVLILPGAKIFTAQNLVEDILHYCKQEGYMLCAGITGHTGLHCTAQGLLEQSASALQDAIEQKVAVRLYKENLLVLDARRTLVQSHEKRFLFGAL